MIIDISAYKAKSGDSFLFDTNIWFYIHHPMGYKNKKKIKKYSNFYKRIRDKEIFITSQIISEFINRCLKHEYENTNNNTYKIFKDYRKSADGQKAISTIIINTKKILNNCKKLNDTLTINQLISIIDRSTQADFNDILSIEQAREEHLKIVTDDSDFGYFHNDFDILTYNKHLLEMQKI